MANNKNAGPGALVLSLQKHAFFDCKKHAIIYGLVDISTVDSATAKKIVNSYNEIEIFKGGSIHIIY